MSQYDDLKTAVVAALIREMNADEVNASMVTAAIGYLKAFPEDQADMPQTGELTGSLKAYADKMTYGQDAPTPVD